jgi:hypothetical protein
MPDKKNGYAIITPDGYLQAVCPKCRFAFGRNLKEGGIQILPLMCPSCGETLPEIKNYAIPKDLKPERVFEPEYFAGLKLAHHRPVPKSRAKARAK